MIGPYGYIWLVPALPLLGVLLNGFLGPRFGKGFVKLVGPLVILAAFCVSVYAFRQMLSQPVVERSNEAYLWDWISAGIFQVPVTFRIDPLSVTMMLVVTGVGFLIHVYSVGYMAEDALFARFFTYLNLFTFAMLILVMANNYVLMFVGWEGVGLCSGGGLGFPGRPDAAVLDLPLSPRGSVPDPELHGRLPHGAASRAGQPDSRDGDRPPPLAGRDR